MAPTPHFDIDTIRSAANRRWPEILSNRGNIPLELLDGKHHHCPKCGGHDRFRMVDPDAGALFCNQCFSEKNGDGLAALQWSLGIDFGQALQIAADYLGIKPSDPTDAASRKQKSKATGKPKKVFKSLYDAAVAVYAGLVKDKLEPSENPEVWEYPDAAGQVSFAVVRWNVKGGKEFRPFHKVSQGWSIGDPPAGKIPLYGLAGIAAADIVYLVEGEKCVDAAAALGLVAVTSAHGSKSPQLSDWAPLAGKRIVAFPDNDKPGEGYVIKAAKILAALENPATVTIRRIPGLAEGGDIADFIESKTGIASETILAELAALPDELPGEAPPLVVVKEDDDPHRLARMNLTAYEGTDGGKLRYWREQFYRWKPASGCYQLIGAEELRAKTGTIIEQEFDRLNIIELLEFQKLVDAGKVKDGKPPRAKRVTRTLVSNVLEATKGLVLIPSSVEPMTWLDGKTRERRNYVAMKNGILDLDAVLADADSVMLPSSPKWFSTVRLPYAFDPDATCPKWLAFLNYNLGGDQQLIARLQEWAGYLLTPDTGQQKFLMMRGEGSNGKSVYMAAITAMLGKENVSNVSLEAFGERFSLATTIGKLANICGDCEEMDKVAEGFIKSFASGDRMTFDRKNIAPIETVPTARLMIAANELPRIRDRSNGMWRRMLLIPWDIQIPDSMKIPNMDKSTWWEESGELPGILIWAILGLARLRSQGRFTDAAASNLALAGYKSDVNSARAFLNEYVQEANPLEGDRAFVRTDFLYEHYSRWARAGNLHPFSKITFCKEINRAIPAAKYAQLSEIGGQEKKNRHTGYRYIEFSQAEIGGQSTVDSVALSNGNW